jgi:Protein of unknown function (DUF2934)
MHTDHTKLSTLVQSGSTKPSTAMQTAVAPGDKNQKAQFASGEAIRLCAYRKWERAGKPAGDGIQFWLEAERELAPSSPDRDSKMEARTQATRAHDQSQDADRHSKTRHPHSVK